MKTKKVLSLLLAILMVMCIAACGSSGSSAAAPKESATYTAGICWYSIADTFIANANTSLLNIAKADGLIKVTAADSQGAAETQESNMQNFYTQDVDFILLNNLKSNDIPNLIEGAKAEGKTIIFVNANSPTAEDFAIYDKSYCVSSYAPESGTIMGQALVEYFDTHENWDRNGNGVVDCVMLLGTQGTYDSECRSGFSVAALEDAGYTVNFVGDEQLCEWSRATAQEKTAALLANFGDDIDCVIACNDDMGLGAIEALQASGYLVDGGDYIPVTAVDATEVGRAAVKEGTLLVTSLNNPVTLAKATYKTMKLLVNGEEITTENLGIDGVHVEGQNVWLGYTRVDKSNVDTIVYDVTDTDIGQ